MAGKGKGWPVNAQSPHPFMILRVMQDARSHLKL
ncbi:predicted protein [Chaetomium globosum CBS 148.51]|uniref:Uncharacterized protein n=1 Tax=Chaetomium globosum (strain ATCC 6205 / CBS 148.51 / DSM 1962 / NBRC 6347 / NRRL 1970) TaxID=306901 RepID=Q2GMW3_CHAGB|nr:uncharacterized protein CHGG_10691 [Chaetomium globosum CBS 148.51]EAQ84287.1 predicted protein [Chaetomium globosum CBS 148.51]